LGKFWKLLPHARGKAPNCFLLIGKVTKRDTSLLA